MNRVQAVQALGALAQESRLAIFRLLVREGPAGLVAGDIAANLGLAPATLSFHLKALSQAGLVTARQEGRYLRYVADFAAMHGLVDFLSEKCCGGQRSDCAPAAQAGRRKQAR